MQGARASNLGPFCSGNHESATRRAFLFRLCVYRLGLGSEQRFAGVAGDLFARSVAQTNHLMPVG